MRGLWGSGQPGLHVPAYNTEACVGIKSLPEPPRMLLPDLSVLLAELLQQTSDPLMGPQSRRGQTSWAMGVVLGH